MKLIFGLAIGIAIGAPATAAGEPVDQNSEPVRIIRCAPYGDHAGVLTAQFGEHPVFTGQLEGGMVLRIFANTRSGSWTMLLVRTDGLSCVQLAGESGQRDLGY